MVNNNFILCVFGPGERSNRSINALLFAVLLNNGPKQNLLVPGAGFCSIDRAAVGSEHGAIAQRSSHYVLGLSRPGWCPISASARKGDSGYLGLRPFAVFSERLTKCYS